MFLEMRTIECPIRRAVISSLECHECPNRVRVLYRSENPPELQCCVWWSMHHMELSEEDEYPEE